MARFSGGSGSGGDSVPGPQGLPGPTGPAGADGAGFNYQGDFDYGVTYAANDAVTFDGGLWKLNNFIGAAGYTPTPGQWSLILPPGTDGATGPAGADGATGPSGANGSGIVYLGDFIPGNGYITDIAVVKGSDNNLYIAASNGELSDPTYNTGEWNTFLPKGADGADGTDGQGFNYRGAFDSADLGTYVQNDVVTMHNGTYILSTEQAYGQPPLDAWGNKTQPWEVFIPTAQKFRGVYDTEASGPGVGYVNGDVVSYNDALYVFVPKGSYPVEFNYTDPDNTSAENNWNLLVPAGVDGTGFNWRGAWEPTAYYLNDVVEYDGTTYVCVVAEAWSMAAPFGGPMSANPGPNSDWETMASSGAGFRFRGEWSSVPMDGLMSYVENDVVSYQGNTYVAKDNMNDAGVGTPGEQVPENGGNSGWKLMASKGDSFSFEGEYDGATNYQKNDVVLYQNTLYLATSGNPMGTPGGMMSQDWEVFLPKGTTYRPRGTWSSMPGGDMLGDYAVNDFVIYNGNVYLATSSPSGTPGDMMSGSGWTLFVPKATGFRWTGTWSSSGYNAMNYVAGDVVEYEGSTYLCTPQMMGMAGTQPPIYGSGYPNAGEPNPDWELMASVGQAGEGFNFRGAWESMPFDGDYAAGDIVSYDGTLYLGVTNMGMPPSGTPGESMNYSWQVFLGSTAPTWRGEWTFQPGGSYKNNDLVSYNGSTYIAQSDMNYVGSSNPEDSNSDWELFASSGNTGDITFDGVKIIGAGTASGDNYGNGTIELVPDADLVSNQYSNQYLILDPTVPNHIHIRAGGRQDESSADLILGAERTHVKVSDQANNVEVRASRETEYYSYTNLNETSSTEFVVSSDNMINYGSVVNVDGEYYGISNIVSDTPSIGLSTYTTSPLAYNSQLGPANFVSGNEYTFENNNTPQLWSFNSNGYMYGPDESNHLKVYGLTSDYYLALNATEGIELNVEAESFGVQISSNAGVSIYSERTSGYIDNADKVVAVLGDINAAVVDVLEDVDSAIDAAISAAEPTEVSFTVVGGTLGTQPTFDGAPLFSGSYIKTGPQVHFQVQVDMDNITDFGTGQYYINLPFPAKYGYQVRSGCFHDISTDKQYAIAGHVYAGQSQLALTFTNSAGQDEAFDHNSPIALNAEDNFHISGTYIALPSA
jgi:hypothetical protein